MNILNKTLMALYNLFRDTIIRTHRFLASLLGEGGDDKYYRVPRDTHSVYSRR